MVNKLNPLNWLVVECNLHHISRQISETRQSAGRPVVSYKLFQ